jgi:hypothetical protein
MPPIAPIQPALQGAIAAFVHVCNLAQGVESFLAAAEYNPAMGDSASMSRRRSAVRYAGVEPSVTSIATQPSFVPQ